MKEILQLSVAIPSLGLSPKSAVPAFVHEPGQTEAIAKIYLETRGVMHEAYADDEWEAVAQASAIEVRNEHCGYSFCSDTTHKENTMINMHPDVKQERGELMANRK